MVGIHDWLESMDGAVVGAHAHGWTHGWKSWLEIIVGAHGLLDHLAVWNPRLARVNGWLEAIIARWSPWLAGAHD